MAAPQHQFVPDCRVSVDGQKLSPAERGHLARVEVDLNADLFGRCELVFFDAQMELINGKKFASGIGVKVELGFGPSLHKVFEGEVVALEPRFRRDMPPSLHVVCQEAIHRLGLSQKTRALNNVDDKEIVTKIAQEHGLTAQAPSGTKTHHLQSNVTDAVNLRRLAQKDGNVLRLEGKKLIIGPPAKGASIPLKPGDGLKKIKVLIKSAVQVSEVSVHGWEPQQKREIVGKAKPKGETGQGAQKFGKGVLSFAGHEHQPVDTASAEKMAEGRLRKLAEGYVSAQVEMIGDPRAVPGATLELEKMGAQIDGSYRVERARHHFSKHGYFCTLAAVRLSKQTAAAKAAQQAQSQAQKQAQQQAAAAAKASTKPKDWLEIELKGGDGKPAAGKAFRVFMPDGSVIDGTLDGLGKARLEGVPPGQAKVVFLSTGGAEAKPG